MSQVALQSEMLTGKTIRIVGRPLRAIEEHSQLIDLVEARNPDKAETLMGSHIMSALEDIISSHIASNPEPAMQEGVGVSVPNPTIRVPTQNSDSW
jgi:DNA-binding GntR family transcriptional regulator